MKRSLIYACAATAATLAAAACGTGYTASSPAPSSGAASGAAPSTAANGSTTILTASTKVGQILVDGSGRTLYLFEADPGKDSTCYNACAQAWPPVTTTAPPQSGTGVTGTLLGTTTRKDGTMEVTYGGHPLYYFIADKKAGDITGQGINQFGAKWYVLAPSGTKIDTDHAAAPPSTNYGY